MDAARERLGGHLRALYGESAAARTLPRLLALVDAHRPAARAVRAWTQRDCIIVAYADQIRATRDTDDDDDDDDDDDEWPLTTLGRWCDRHLAGLGLDVLLHAIAVRPSTADDGFSVRDYRAVDPAAGTAADLAHLGGRSTGLRLCLDLIVNHCSAQHPWFAQFRAGEEPGRRYFITPEPPDAAWLRGVARARRTPLLTPFETARGTQSVWTTYSADQVDLNWREPDVFLEFAALALEYACAGPRARLLRLDAFVYVWKQPHTPCIALPQSHAVLRLLRDTLDAAGSPAALVASITNVPRSVNTSFLGGAAPGEREAHLVYNFPLGGLLLHALHTGRVGALAEYVARPDGCGEGSTPDGACWVHFAASHDGVGLGWLRGLVPEDELAAVAAAVARRGGFTWMRRRWSGDSDCSGATGATGDDEEAPSIELNVAYFSACAPDDSSSSKDSSSSAEHVDRFIATQSVVLALRGVPSLYFHSLVATPNAPEAVRMEHRRAINRSRCDAAALARVLDDAASAPARVLGRLRALLAARAASPAFRPDSAQRVHAALFPGSAVLAIERAAAAAASDRVLCLANFGPSDAVVDAGALRQAVGCDSLGDMRDLVAPAPGERPHGARLAPYETRWLAVPPFPAPAALLPALPPPLPPPSVYQSLMMRAELAMMMAYFIDGPLTPHLVTAALAALRARHPALSLRCTGDAAAPFGPAATAAIPLDIVRDAGADAWRGVMKMRTLDRTAQVAEATLLLSASPAGPHVVILRLDHAVGDGYSLLLLGGHLIAAIAAAQTAADGDDDAAAAAAAALRALGGARGHAEPWEHRLRAPAGPSDPTVDAETPCDRLATDRDLGLPVPPVACGGGGNLTFESAHAAARPLLRAARRERTSVWGAVQAAVHCAECLLIHARERRPPPYTLSARVITDLRPFLDPPCATDRDGVAAIVSHATTRPLRVLWDTAFWDIARDVRAAAQAALPQAVEHARGRYAARAYASALVTSSTSVNNFGDAGRLVPLARGPFAWRRIEVFGLRPPPTNPLKNKAMKLFCVSAGDTLTLAAHYAPAEITQATARSLLDTALRVLERATGDRCALTLGAMRDAVL